MYGNAYLIYVIIKEIGRVLQYIICRSFCQKYQRSFFMNLVDTSDKSAQYHLEY